MRLKFDGIHPVISSYRNFLTFCDLEKWSDIYHKNRKKVAYLENTAKLLDV